MVTKLETYSDFRWWLADWNIIFVDFWWFGLFALVSCDAFSVVENWFVSWTSTARLKCCDDVRSNDVMMTSNWKLPGKGCKCPSKQFRHRQGTCNLQHMNLENHMFHDKDISLLSSLSSHNLEKTFQKCKNKVNKFLGEYLVRFRACKNFTQAKIDNFLSMLQKQAIYNVLFYRM